MTDKTTDNMQWTDPKDYGLPFVEVVPLKQAATPTKAQEKVMPVDVAEVRRKTIEAVTSHVAESERVSRSEYKIEAKKSTNSWVWIVAILALGVVAVIIWQMNKSEAPVSASDEIVSLSMELANKENAEVAVNSTTGDETQIANNQEIISDSISSVSPITQSVQSGTTIASKVSGTLIRVEEKANRPYFYVIVSSLPTEVMAIEEAQQYMDRTDTVYMILPYEDVANYRLAIAGSIGFTAMTEELARVKDEYTEDLWILKY